MLRNKPDDNNRQITQWIQNESQNYKRQLQNLTDSDLRKLVNYIAKDVREEFQKLENNGQPDLELLKSIMKYISLNKINWHFELNDKTNLYELKLGTKARTYWVTTSFEYEKENNKNYYLINPIRFVWKSDVSEIALKIINDQSDWFFTNTLVSELVVPQKILDEIKLTIIVEFKDVLAALCTIIQEQNVVELQH